LIYNNIQTVNILGIEICSETLSNVLKIIKNLLLKDIDNSKYICATSVHGIIEAQDDVEMKEVLSRSFLNCPDGKPLAFVGRLHGIRRMHQIKGPDLFLHICKITSKMNIRHYFYGGKEGVAKDLSEKMRKRYPGFKVAGFFCPPFHLLSETEKNDIAHKINISKADIVWVGLSTPKQEKWAAEFKDRLEAKIIFTVGAAFDFHTGNIKFAPPWMCKIGLEWLYRLISEPKRLWPRYSRIVPLFLYLSVLQLLKIRKYQ